MTENQKPQSMSDVVRPQNDSVGEMLRAARMSRNLTIEEVAAALRIRHVQLRAIEENNIEALPGITYAVGFVRSYANFVGLNGMEIVHKFKAEQGHTSAQSKLDFPEPVAESRMPDPIMVGVGAFLAILVLVLWTFYSSMNSGASKEAEQIQPAPAVTTTAEAPPLEAQAETPPGADTVSALTAAPAAESVPAPQSVPGETAAPAPAPAPVQPEAVVTAEPPAATEVPAEAPPEEISTTMWNKSPEKKADSVIKIKRAKSHILLQANQSSWVQITDAKGDVIYKKVLRPGDQYYVPDQAGLSLVTANAGGLVISVDGKAVQPIGKPGEIVRGVNLDPAELKKTRARVSD